MDAISNQVATTGHASEVRHSEQNLWRLAGSGSSRIDWSIIARIEHECDEIERQFESLVEADPVGASKSIPGQIHLRKWDWLWDKAIGYPYCFGVEDVVCDAPYIAAQLVAQEYFMRGKESSPLTPEAFMGFDFDNNRQKRRTWQDPFSMEPTARPGVTIEATDKDGKTYTYNQNPILPPGAKPLEGFRDAS